MSKTQFIPFVLREIHQEVKQLNFRWLFPEKRPFRINKFFYMNRYRKKQIESLLLISQGPESCEGGHRISGDFGVQSSVVVSNSPSPSSAEDSEDSKVTQQWREPAAIAQFVSEVHETSSVLASSWNIVNGLCICDQYSGVWGSSHEGFMSESFVWQTEKIRNP